MPAGHTQFLLDNVETEVTNSCASPTQPSYSCRDGHLQYGGLDIQAWGPHLCRERSVLGPHFIFNWRSFPLGLSSVHRSVLSLQLLDGYCEKHPTKAEGVPQGFPKPSSLLSLAIGVAGLHQGTALLMSSFLVIAPHFKWEQGVYTLHLYPVTLSRWQPYRIMVQGDFWACLQPITGKLGDGPLVLSSSSSPPTSLSTSFYVYPPPLPLSRLSTSHLLRAPQS